MTVQKTLIGGAIEGKNEKDNFGKLQLKEEKDNFVVKITFALTKPHIVYPSPWAETIPEKLKREVPLHRLAQLIKGEEGKATDLECLIYLYPASMEFPLSREWYKIYSFLFVQFVGKEKANFLKEEEDTLDDSEIKELDMLKKWIWKKQWKHYKEKKREEKKAEIITEKYKQAKLNFEE